MGGNGFIAHRSALKFMNRSRRGAPNTRPSPRRPGHQRWQAKKPKDNSLCTCVAKYSNARKAAPPLVAPPQQSTARALPMINRGSQLRISPPAHPPSARSRTLMALSPTPTAVAAPPPEPGPEPAPSAELPLPDAIAAALPPDPYEQLEVARKITAVAVASRASRLELEAARLRQRLADRDRLAAELADRAAKLEQALRDADARLRSALDDNVRFHSPSRALCLLTDEPVDFGCDSVRRRRPSWPRSGTRSRRRPRSWPGTSPR
jgi:hypothetical protein